MTEDVIASRARALAGALARERVRPAARPRRRDRDRAAPRPAPARAVPRAAAAAAARARPRAARRRRSPATWSGSCACCARRSPRARSSTATASWRYVETLGIRNPVRSRGAGRVERGLRHRRPAGRVRPAALRDRALSVQESPDRQPRRDRAAHQPGLSRAGRRDRRDLLRGRPRSRSTSGTPTKRSASGPGPVMRSYLNIPNIISAALISGCDAIHPGLRLPGRERALRRDRGRPRADVHRAQAGGDQRDGRQGHREAADGAKPACRPRRARDIVADGRRGARGVRPRSATRCCSRRPPAAAARACAR